MDAGAIGDRLLAMRDELCVAPDLFTRARHLAAMEAAANDVADAVGAAGRQRPRALVLVGAATLGVLALTSGLAAAGTLPAPVQRQAARMAHAVGLEIPGRGDAVKEVPTGGSAPGPDPTSRRSPRPNRGSTDPSPPPATVGSGAATGRSSVPTPAAIPPIPAPAPDVPDVPGGSGDAPGRTGSGSDAPGNSGNAPGHADPVPSAPGNSGNAPGRTGSDAPGKSGSAPGHAPSTDGPASAPGNSGNAPGRAAG